MDRLSLDPNTLEVQTFDVVNENEDPTVLQWVYTERVINCSTNEQVACMPIIPGETGTVC